MEPSTAEQELIARLDKWERELHDRWLSDDKRDDERHKRDNERHLEVVRRLTAVEAQTTQTNGKVRELEIDERVRKQLEAQAETFKTKYDRENNKRKDRSRQWLLVAFAAALGMVGTLVGTVLELIRQGILG
jgi:hypothetical protein